MNRFLTLTLLATMLPLPVHGQGSFAHCNSLLEHGITDVTVHRSAKHAIAFKWHSYCGMDFERASDAVVRQASVSIFGIASGGAGDNTSRQRQSLKQWCDQNSEFAEQRADLFEEARVVGAPALYAWNQCQEIARKSVTIRFLPQGEYSRFVHFEIDSTLDAELRFYGVHARGYSCSVELAGRDGQAVDIESRPAIGSANIQIDCERDEPELQEVDHVGRLTYAEGYISVNTSGPALPVAFPQVVKEYMVTPPRSVLAFDSTECPAGWTEFEAAFGRFVRGIDKSEQSRDPDGLRAPGHVQGDAFKSHSHQYNQWMWQVSTGSGPYPDGLTANRGNYPSLDTTTVGSAETRPKNVALLYCIKD